MGSPSDLQQWNERSVAKNAADDSTVCTYWDHFECEGTNRCPPRCPRYVDRYGAPLLIKPVDTVDTDRISAFQRQVVEMTDDESGDLSESDSFEGVGFVAEQNGTIVGRATLDESMNPPEAETVVRPDLDGRGIHEELLRHVVATTAEDDYTMLAIPEHTDEQTHTAAERVGFSTAEDDKAGSVLTLSLDSEIADTVRLPPAQRSENVRERNLTGQPLQKLFEPDRVALVGASDRDDSLGAILLSNLTEDFAGDVVPINPGREEVDGLPAYPDLATVPGTVDLAIVAVAADRALDTVRQAGREGIDNVVVIAGGFSEASDDGRERERELRQIADAYDLTVIGPNSMGIMASGRSLNATFAPASPDQGGISVMSQSGAFITALLDWGENAGVGFNHVVSLGNKAVVDETDLLEHWEQDSETDVVVAYTEGLENGDRFLETAQSVTHETPVVLLEGGRTDDGEAAAASHTGALAGGGAATADVLAQAGVFHVTSVETLLDLAGAFAGQPLPDGDSVSIVTNAGGPGVLAADAVSEAGLQVCGLSNNTREKLADTLPDAAAVGNPVDVLGDADVDRFERAIDATLADDQTDAAVVLTTPHPLVDYADLAERIATLRAQYDKPVVTCLMAGDIGAEAQETLADHGIPNYFAPGRAARSLRGLLTYHEISDRRIAPAETFDVDYDRADRVIDRVLERYSNRDSIGVEGIELLSAYGIPTPEGALAESPDEAVQVGERIDDPVALKAVCPDLVHKSDVGGVALDVTTDGIPDAYEDVIAAVREARPDATLDGVYVQSMASTPGGVETIVGVHRDESFGPVVAFGLGGVFVETFDDLAFRAAPVSEQEARSMIDQIEAADLLYGVRGREPVDIDALVETIQRVSQLAVERQNIVELDINPLVATPDGVTALDLQASIRQ